jgi:hypothetical protein
MAIMKRSEALNAIAYIIMDYKYEDTGDSDETALRVLSYLEDLGMQPPICTVTIKDGKHTPTEYKWDEE